MNQIKISTNLENPELPTLPQVLYEHLEAAYNIDHILSRPRPKTNDELIGYIRGVREVLAMCRVLAEIEEDKE